MKFIYLVIAVAAIWYCSWLWVDRNVYSVAPWMESHAAIRALFGDKFGAINSLFSGLAFAGIIFTVLLQKRELALQREEVARNRDQLVEQNRTLNRQRFENTFFKMLELQSDITSKLDMLGSLGRKAHVDFQTALIESDTEFQIYKSLGKLTREQVRQIQDAGIVEVDYPALSAADVSTLTDALIQIPRAFESYLDDDIEMHRAKLKIAYQKVASKYLDSFSHYFRSLYRVLDFVHSNEDLKESEKNKYAKIMRSQLSDAELVCLFYNALMPYEIPGRPMELGFPKLGRLLIAYNILHNMNEADVIHRTHQKIFQESYRGEAR
ncbi:putative phage abortive infection protein [Novilysobacter erysipheiresistens]